MAHRPEAGGHRYLGDRCRLRICMVKLVIDSIQADGAQKLQGVVSYILANVY